MADAEPLRAHACTWQTSEANLNPNLESKNIFCRRLSSCSESGCESGFHSDLSDDVSGSQPSTADSTDSGRSPYLNNCTWPDSSDQVSIEQIKRDTRQLAKDVVSHMTGICLCGTGSPYAPTVLRVVDDLSSRHEILFKSIVKRLGIDKIPDPNACQQTFTGVCEELFADGQYNWGRIVTLYAFAGWLARSYCKSAEHDSSSCHKNVACAAIAAAAGEYMAEKLSEWISQKGGWSTVERFFAGTESVETKLWRGLMFTFVGLGVMAAIAAAR